MALNAVDTIPDFEAAATDKIELSSAIFTSLAAGSPLNAANFVSGVGAVALDADDHAIFDTSSGNFFTMQTVAALAIVSWSLR